jgi:uncharacterized membrane protein YfcA
MLALIILGVVTGALSGFFGIGGGTILVPMLLILGYSIKEAIGISIIQMLFSSIYGSYLNKKKGTLDFSMVLTIGLGGFFGAIFSGVITANANPKTLEITLFIFIVFALIKMFFKPIQNETKKDVSKITLFALGCVLGVISMSIGIGGGVLLVPILIVFFQVELKKAISAGLFFVMFASVSGVISHSLNRELDFQSGITIGLASLIGVYIGIILKDKIDNKPQKKLLLGFYSLLVIYLINRIFING